MLSKNPTQCPAWKKLEKLQKRMADVHMNDLHADDPETYKKFHLKLDGLYFDYSRHLVADDVMNALIDLAQECGVEEQRAQMHEGARINATENRPALHMALRGSVDKDLTVEGENVAAFVKETLGRIEKLSAKIRSEGRIADVVNIGIGGSELGPHMVCEALKSKADGPCVHFVSNIDGAQITETLKNLNPKTTLFIVASKTFTTLETMENARAAKDWSGQDDCFIAVTANPEAAQKFGITPDNILPMRDWIGGRFSVWSAVGLPVAIANGFAVFKELLDGAHVMDSHFLSAPLGKNMPVIMALLGLWYRNFWDFRAYGIFPYAHGLRRLPDYVRQVDMESNGKSVDRHGTPLTYATSPVVFGEPGTDAQHAFFQMLHQGSDRVPCDFIGVVDLDHTLNEHHANLLANMLAQAQGLMEGHSSEDGPHKNCAGNRPSSTILINRLDAYHLGMLMALYEHKIFVQGCIWNINSFDQWGVELGKTMAKTLTEAIEKNEKTIDVDASTQGLIQYIRAHGK